MADSLPVYTNRPDQIFLWALGPGLASLGVELCQLQGGNTGAGQFIVPGMLQSQQLVSQSGWHGQAMGLVYLRPLRTEGCQYGIHTVHAGTGHQSDKQGGLHGLAAGQLYGFSICVQQGKVALVGSQGLLELFALRRIQDAGYWQVYRQRVNGFLGNSEFVM
jgi:hypothetical protein